MSLTPGLERTVYLKSPPRSIPRSLVISLMANRHAVVGATLFGLSGLGTNRLGAFTSLTILAAIGLLILSRGIARGRRELALLRNGKVVQAEFERAPQRLALPLERLTPELRAQLVQFRPVIHVLVGCTVLPFAGMGLLFAGIGAWMIFRVSALGEAVTIDGETVRDPSVAIPQLIPFVVIGLIFAAVGIAAFIGIRAILRKALGTIEAQAGGTTQELSGLFHASLGSTRVTIRDRVAAGAAQLAARFPMLYDEARRHGYLLGGASIPARVGRTGEWEEAGSMAGLLRAVVIVAALLIGAAGWMRIW